MNYTNSVKLRYLTSLTLLSFKKDSERLHVLGLHFFFFLQKIHPFCGIQITPTLEVNTNSKIRSPFFFPFSKISHAMHIRWDARLLKACLIQNFSDATTCHVIRNISSELDSEFFLQLLTHLKSPKGRGIISLELKINHDKEEKIG